MDESDNKQPPEEMSDKVWGAKVLAVQEQYLNSTTPSGIFAMNQNAGGCVPAQHVEDVTQRVEEVATQDVAQHVEEVATQDVAQHVEDVPQHGESVAVSHVDVVASEHIEQPCAGGTCPVDPVTSDDENDDNECCEATEPNACEQDAQEPPVPMDEQPDIVEEFVHVEDDLFIVSLDDKPMHWFKEQSFALEFAEALTSDCRIRSMADYDTVVNREKKNAFHIYGSPKNVIFRWLCTRKLHTIEVHRVPGIVLEEVHPHAE